MNDTQDALMREMMEFLQSAIPQLEDAGLLDLAFEAAKLVRKANGE